MVEVGVTSNRILGETTDKIAVAVLDAIQCDRPLVIDSGSDQAAARAQRAGAASGRADRRRGRGY
jgi:hypothetical protein